MTSDDGESGRRDGDPTPPPGRARRPDTAVETLVWAGVRMVRRLAIGLIGATVLLIGLVMTVMPGPAIVVIPIGLAILAIEFAWARHLLRQFRERAERVRDAYRGRGR